MEKDQYYHTIGGHHQEFYTKMNPEKDTVVRLGMSKGVRGAGTLGIKFLSQANFMTSAFHWSTTQAVSKEEYDEAFEKCINMFR